MYTNPSYGTPSYARVVSDRIDLQADLVLLSRFLMTDDFKALDETDQDVLINQHRGMERYHAALLVREHRIRTGKSSEKHDLTQP